MLGFGALGELALGEIPTQGEDADALAPGDLLVCDASLLAGQASAIVAVSMEVNVVSGGPFSHPRRDIKAYGRILRVRASLVPGKVASVSLLPGVVSGDAQIKSHTLLRTVEIIPGKVSARSNDGNRFNEWTDEELALFLALAEAA